MGSTSELINTEYYSLSELFSNNRRIVIPDFQRDYCWGDKTHGENKVEIVSAFLETLKEESKGDGETLLGKIDVYQHPQSYICLTDGQQRLTTLFLLIGVLYKRTLIEQLKHCLISDEEITNSSNTPFLQYTIRESSVFFLKDLVIEFFIGRNIQKVSEIKKQPWFFNEYNLDPTISSMLSSLEIIEKFITTGNFELVDFAHYLISKVKIQYYDVIDKVHGEERFVIINTTGKSLSESENIKPILLGKVSNDIYSKQWEDRETWFWEHKSKSELIADNGVNTFITWFFQIIERQESVDIIKRSKDIFKREKFQIEETLSSINRHFVSIKMLIDLLQSDKRIAQQLTFINGYSVQGFSGLRNLSKDKLQIVVLPLLSFMVNISVNHEELYEGIRRIRKNYFDYYRTHRKSNYVDWRYVLQIIDRSKSLDEFIEFDSSKLYPITGVALPVKKWYQTSDELLKELKKSNKSVVEVWEDYPDFMGDITPLFKVSGNSIEINCLESFFTTYKELKLGSHVLFKNIALKNKYFLFDLLDRGTWQYRSVAGYGYCMLDQSRDFPFLMNDFYEIWQNFNSLTSDQLDIYLKRKLKIQIQYLMDGDNNILNDTYVTQNTDRRDLVRIWLILEVLSAGDTEINFSNSIACFWEYPNLAKIVSVQHPNLNNYKLGNLLLGTSYFNNKSGWMLFDKFPLMKELSIKKDKITDDDILIRTAEYKKLLLKEFDLSKDV